MPNAPEGLDPEYIAMMESTRSIATQVREFYLALIELQFTPDQSMTLTCKWIYSMMMATASVKSASQ